MVLELLAAPPVADGTTIDWGIVSSVDPMTFSINGIGPPVDIARHSDTGSAVVAGDKILALRNGYGGYVYLDLIDDVVIPAAPGVPITSLQPDAVDPVTGLPTTPEEPPIDPATGLFPRFARLNTPSNVQITNIQWNRVSVTWDYTRSTDPLVPAETGFEVRIRDVHAGQVRTSEDVSGSATRGRTLGSLEPTTWYEADVRAITDAGDAYTSYSANQVQAVLSRFGESLADLFSAWASSNRVRTRPPPLSPVIPPSSVRWVPPLRHDRLGLAWRYADISGSPVATGFEVKVCTNSQGNQGCVSNDVNDPTARERIMRPLDDNVSYFGFVRTKSGNRNSRWESIGPPRRTPEDNAPAIRNLRLTRSTDDPDNATWTAEVRHTTRLSTKVVWQQQRTVAQTRQNAGPPLVQDFHQPLPISGLSDRDVWSPISGTLTGDYAGVGILTFTLRAHNNFSKTDASASLSTRALPAILAVSLTQIGNRLHHAVATATLGRAAGIGIGHLLRGAGGAARGFWNLARNLPWYLREFTRQATRGAPRGFVITPKLLGEGLTEVGSRAAQAAAGATAAGLGEAARRSLLGIRVEVGLSAVGWETAEVQLGVRLPGTDTFTTDYSWNYSNDYTQEPGTARYTSRDLAAADILNVLDTRYYVPGAEIRARVRVTNSVGTTDWAEAKYRGTEYLNPLAIRSGSGDNP